MEHQANVCLVFAKWLSLFAIRDSLCLCRVCVCVCVWHLWVWDRAVGSRKEAAIMCPSGCQRRCLKLMTMEGDNSALIHHLRGFLTNRDQMSVWDKRAFKMTLESARKDTLKIVDLQLCTTAMHDIARSNAWPHFMTNTVYSIKPLSVYPIRWCQNTQASEC